MPDIVERHARRRRPADARQPAFDQRVGARLDPAGDAGVGRAAVGAVVLESPISWGIVRRGDDDAVGAVVGSPAVVRHDGVADHRRRGEAATRIDPHVDAVARQHLARGDPRRLRQGMGVAAEEQRPVDAVGRAPVVHRLRHGEDVPLVERRIERRAAMPRGAERHTLGRHAGVGSQGEIGIGERGKVGHAAVIAARAGRRKRRRGPGEGGDRRPRK